MEFAYAQLGKPYEWGSTGPNSYDCSGLTGASWRTADVSLPRTVNQQYNAGRQVARSDLQPGTSPTGTTTASTTACTSATARPSTHRAPARTSRSPTSPPCRTSRPRGPESRTA
ncbi:C40 family peptidase [Streptomyces thermospinosisporus]|uniref:C40 family peptidase n=1 Tax=Streptomyces thermospinosisporus TaxID=161482 RepID=UPI0031D0484F